MTAILFTSEAFGRRHGGVSRYFAELHRGLQELGATSTIFAGMTDNAHIAGLDKVLHLRVGDFPGRGSANRLLDRAASRTLARGHIVHDTWYASRRLGPGPQAVTVHDLAFLLFPELLTEDTRTAGRQRRAVERADIILTVSESSKRDLLQHFDVDPARVTVTPLGVRPAAAMSNQPARDRRRFLFVGRRSSYKNWATAAAAVAHGRRFAPFKLLCAGGGPFTPSEQSLLQRLGVAGAVQQAELDESSLVRAYQTSAGLLYPSQYEGFGLPLLEAMQQGCPVLASTAAALVETAGGAALHLEPFDVDAWSEALQFTSDPSNVRSHVEAGYVRASSFTWRRTAAATLSAYKRVSGAAG